MHSGGLGDTWRATRAETSVAEFFLIRRGGHQVGYVGSGCGSECCVRVGVTPMDLKAMRYAGYVTSPLQWNVQFDRHPTEVGLCFGPNAVQSTISEGAVHDARNATYAVRWFVWDGRDWRVVWYVREFWGREIGYVRITRTVGKAHVAGKCSEGAIARTEAEVKVSITQ